VSTGAPFSVTLAEDLVNDGSVAFPQGTRIEGVIAVTANETGSSKKLLLNFQTIEDPYSEKLPIAAEIVQRGSVIHVKRGLKDIQITAYTRSPASIMGIGISSNGNRKTRVKRERPNLAVGKSSDVHIIKEAESPRDSHVRLISNKTNPLLIMKGDEFKIELSSNLIYPKFSRSSESH
jgi:hypothetical protein